MATSPIYGWAEPDNTDLVKNGALAIRTLGNAIDTTMGTMTPKATVTAKGSLIAATAASTPANLSVGANGETLVADSSAATGLRYQANFAAGKNKIINGDFGIWQRGTSFTTPASGSYLADRFKLFYGGAGSTRTISQQTFTPGTAPVAGYEGQFFLRYDQSVAGTGDTFNQLDQNIENVRTFAGQTVTLSFWAKAAASTTLGVVGLNQQFGTGGSTSTSTNLGTPTITTSWTRYSYTATLPSLSGKTIGTNNFLELRFLLPNDSTFTLDLWGLQVEAGSVATAFQTASGGSYQNELAMCQRYYQRITPATVGASFSGFASTTSQALFSVPFAQTMRTAPTALEQTGTATDYAIRSTAGNTNCNSAPTFISASTAYMVIDAQVAAALTAGQGVLLRFNNAGVTYLGWSAEL